MDNCASGIGIFMTIILMSFYICNTWISYYSPRPSFEVLVRQPKGQEFSLARLSPKRDKLFYRLSNGAEFMLDLVTGQKHELKNRCNIWLDHEILVCSNRGEPYLLDVRDLSITSLDAVDAEKQSYAKLISGIERVYKYKEHSYEHAYLIKSTDEKFYYLFNVKQPIQFEANISVTVIPYLDWGNNSVSPDGKYYYQLNSENWARIYDRTDDRLVREISLKGIKAQAAGWMYDSSGVIYITFRGYFDFDFHPVYKLNVSLKEGLIRLARNSLIGLILLFGTPYLLRRLWRFWRWPQNRLLLVLVPQPPNDQFSVVSLSPEGDKLAYVLSSGRAFILDLATGKTHWLPKKCEQQTWLDNQTLLCHNRQEAFKVDVRNLLSISISEVTAKKEELPDLDTHSHLASPNGKYYCTYSTTEGLRILTTQDKQLVRKLTFENTKTHLVGWFYDSSGVIFVNNNPVLGDTECPIYKLNVRA